MSQAEYKNGLPPWPVYSEDEIEAVSTVLRAGKANYWFGEHGKLFEKEFADYCGSRFALTAGNGTLALEMALHGLGIGQGDEVIVTPRSFVASANCIVQAGARPVFADVDPDSQNITAASIAEKISAKTRAIIAVHLAGWPCEMNDIMDLARDRSISVIEDCAQAHGATLNGIKAGSLGHAAAFSFCHDKIISTGGEGGMLVTDDESAWGRAAALRNHGKDPRAYEAGVMGTQEQGQKDTFGSNFRMPEPQSVIGRKQLAMLDDWLVKRRRNAAMLDKSLDELAAVRVTVPPAHIEHAYYKYYFFLKPQALKAGWDRSRVIAAIAEKGIPCSPGTSGEIYALEAYSESDFAIDRELPVAHELASTSVMLPVPPTYDESCMEYVCDCVSDIMSEASA